MKSSLLKILNCPRCQSDFTLKMDEEKNGEIFAGKLLCNCGQVFPIINSIPRILLRNDQNFCKEAKEGKTKKSFEFEWQNYHLDMGNEKNIFLEETQIPAELWNKKFVLDVGCGMGRYTKIPLQLGAEVVGMDLGLSVENAFRNLYSFPGCHIIQADLMNPPFKAEAFDIVYSLGVLHHTPDTKKAFKKIAKLVKNEGIISVWVYGKAGKYKDFITNPLRTNRESFGNILFKPPVSYLFWLAIKTRETISNFLRLFTTRMPVKLLYYFCFLLSFLGKIPMLKYFTFSVLPDWKARVWENFDWLSPPFQHHHTKEELVSWFKEEGFAELSILPHGLIPKPGMRGKKIE